MRGTRQFDKIGNTRLVWREGEQGYSAMLDVKCNKRRLSRSRSLGTDKRNAIEVFPSLAQELNTIADRWMEEVRQEGDDVDPDTGKRRTRDDHLQAHAMMRNEYQARPATAGSAWWWR